MSYEVETLKQMKIVKGKKYFLVHWKGYQNSDDTWEPEENLDNCKHLLQQFLKTQKRINSQNGDNSNDIEIYNVCLNKSKSGYVCRYYAKNSEESFMIKEDSKSNYSKEIIQFWEKKFIQHKTEKENNYN